MACAAAERPELIEAYLLGDLDEPARELFERHLFACDRCLSHLRTLEALQTELRKAQQTIRAELIPGRQRAAWTWLAAAATVLIVTGLAFWRPWTGGSQPAPVAGQPAPSSALLLALGTIDPPRYVPLELRGTEPEADFAAAMRAYAAGDYRAAAGGLRNVRDAGATDPQTDFFFAVASLMLEPAAAPSEAIDALQRVVAAGESPYQQLASLYLGKALVRRGDLDAAETEWTRTARLPGVHTREAEDLLKALRSARQRP